MQPTNPLRRAARQPWPLIVLAVAVFAGLRVAWWLFPVGLLAYGVMVLLLARDPALAITRQPRPRISSPTFRAQLAAVERSQREIQRNIAQADGPIQRLLTPIAEQTRELVDDAYTLCAKGQVIESYLARTNLQQIQTRIAEADREFRTTQDPYIARQLEETINALTKKQRNAADLQTYVGRIEAQLQNINANLDNVLAETVRLRTADTVSADSVTNQVAERLRDLQSDMQTFQRVLDTALSGTNP
jgi:chromosome segregation ATPase